MNRIENNAAGNKSENQNIRVFIADDHRLVRQTLRRRIEKEDDMTVVGEAANGKEALALITKALPDVLIIDINMPEMDGATRKISALCKQIRIIGFSLYDHKGARDSMIKAGAVAYSTKSDDLDQLLKIIRRTAVNNTG